MKAVCVCVVLCTLVSLSSALDAALFARASWQSVNYAAPAKPLAYAGPPQALGKINVDGKPGGYFSGAGDQAARFDANSETWWKGLFAAVVDRVKNHPNTVNHKLDWCLSFHGHVYRKKKDDGDMVVIFHNRECCAVTTQDAATSNRVWPNAKLFGIEPLSKDNMGAPYPPPCPTVCSQSVADQRQTSLDRHLMVYSTTDGKLYYWDTYANYLTAFKKYENTDFAAPLATGGAYAHVFADSVIGVNPTDHQPEVVSPTWEKVVDVNISPTSQQVWAQGDAKSLERAIALRANVVAAAAATVLTPPKAKSCDDWAKGKLSSCRQCVTDKSSADQPCVWIPDSDHQCIPRSRAKELKLPVNMVISHPLACPQ